MDISPKKIKFQTVEDYLSWSTVQDQTILKVLYINIRSLQKKMDLLKQTILSTNTPDIICLTENWLCNNDLEYFNLPNDSLFHAMKTTSSGGGCAIYVRNIWHCTVLSRVEKHHSIISVKIDNSERVFTVSCIYNPHFSNSLEFLNAFEQVLSTMKYKHVYIFGDFNIDLNKQNRRTSFYRNTVKPLKDGTPQRRKPLNDGKKSCDGRFSHVK